jgi:hypothetical protein
MADGSDHQRPAICDQRAVEETQLGRAGAPRTIPWAATGTFPVSLVILFYNGVGWCSNASSSRKRKAVQFRQRPVMKQIPLMRIGTFDPP